jgi:hypothetical protein
VLAFALERAKFAFMVKQEITNKIDRFRGEQYAWL